jgi:hypothetical protein
VEPWSGTKLLASGLLDRCFDIVVDAGRGQQAVLATLVDGDSGLRRQGRGRPYESARLSHIARLIQRTASDLCITPDERHS